MATICPKCWKGGTRTVMDCVPDGTSIEYTPCDLLPDGTMIRHPKRRTGSVYGTCTCPLCGHTEREAGVNR